MTKFLKNKKVFIVYDNAVLNGKVIYDDDDLVEIEYRYNRHLPYEKYEFYRRDVFKNKKDAFKQLQYELNQSLAKSENKVDMYKKLLNKCNLKLKTLLK